MKGESMEQQREILDRIRLEVDSFNIKDCDKMLVFRAGDISPDELWGLIDSVQRFAVLGVGMDREILAQAMVNRINCSDCPLDEIIYYQCVLKDLHRVLVDRVEALGGLG